MSSLNLSFKTYSIFKFQRWLLIECKREFAFEDSLTALEVMWATINTTSAASSSSSTNIYNKLMSSPSPSPSMQSLSFLNNSNNANKSMSTSNINDEVAIACKSSTTSPFQVGRCLGGGEIVSSYKSISNASSISMRILRQIDPTYNNNNNINGNFF